METQDKIRCLIVDDEFPARILLKEFIEKVPNLELVASCKSGLEALPIVQSGSVDLLFLDIQMPDITGVNFLKMLPVRPLVVFTTAYSDYAIESYQLDVLDYLLKPFSFDRFMQSIGKAMQRLGERQARKATEPVQQPVEEPEDNEQGDSRSCANLGVNGNFLIVRADHKLYRIRFDSITYIEGMKEYVTIHYADEQVMALGSMKGLEDLLPKADFIRIHRSFIVRIDKIVGLNGVQLKVEGIKQPLPVGRSYKDFIQDRLFRVGEI